MSKKKSSLTSAPAELFQDLGFNLDESEIDLGLIIVSKKRDATEADQVFVALTMAALFSVDTAIDREQKIRASVVTCPARDTKVRMAVRVTF